MTPVDYSRRVDLRPFLNGDDLFIHDGPVGRVTSRYKFNSDGDIVEVENGGILYNYVALLCTNDLFDNYYIRLSIIFKIVNIVLYLVGFGNVPKWIIDILILF